jgi:hypothetical protein
MFYSGSITISKPRAYYEKLSSDHLGELSASIRERVHVRFEGLDIICPKQEPGLSQL